VIPAQKSKIYTTSEDNQIAVTNKVFEGERLTTSENRLLGAFELSGFPALPRGQAQIEVTFDVDVNGILSVSAVEKTSNKAAKITIKNSDRLSDEAIERMVNEAKELRAEDERAVARIAARTALEGYLYQVKSAMRDTTLRGRMDEDDASAISAEVAAADAWIDEHDDASLDDYAAQLERLRTEGVGPLLLRYGVDFSDGEPDSLFGDDDRHNYAQEHEEL